MSLLEQGRSLLAAAQQVDPESSAELYLRQSEGRVSEWSEGVPENKFFSKSQGAGLRLVREKCLGFAHSNVWAPEGMQRMAQYAAAACKTTAPDADFILPSASTSTTRSTSLDVIDASLTPETFAPRSHFLEALQSDILKRDSRLTKVLQASYREGTSTEVLVSSSGVATEQTQTYSSFSLGCVAVQGTETQVGYGSQTVCHYKDLDIARVVDKTVRQTLALLQGKQVPSGRYDLVLDPWIVTEFLGLFAEALSADAVQKGKSFLAKWVGKSMGGSAVHLVDDPHRPRAAGSCLFDAEGQPTTPTTLIEGGILKQFLYDSRTARKAGRSVSGNAARSSYKVLPEPSPSNFYLQTGTQTPEALIQEVKRGLYIHNVMGFHTVDTIGGDYSLGIMGEFIQNGERVHGVRGVTIAGNLLDFLKQVDAAASDLLFTGSFGSPTLRVRDISVGGL